MINDGEYLLVGGRPTPLKNMSSSVGMIIPNIWKNKNVPNHQPVGDVNRPQKNLGFPVKSPISIGQPSLLRECSNPGTFSACSRTSRLFTWFKYTMASLEASNAEGE